MGVFALVVFLSAGALAGARQHCSPSAPLEDRVRRAPIVFHGLSVSPTPGEDAQFWLIEVYKGSRALAELLHIEFPPKTSVVDIRDRPVNLTGLVATECLPPGVVQQHYVVLGAVMDGRLVVEEEAPLVTWSKDIDKSVWQALGWEPWNDWDSCSVSCGEGSQHRWRTCRLPQGCEGFNKQTRRCNMFSCQGAVSPLSSDLRQFVHGQWGRVPDRPAAWRLRPTAYLWLPASELPGSTSHLRRHFTLLLTLRLDPKEAATGTLFSLRSRSVQNTYLSVELAGREAVRLVHSGTNGTKTVMISAPLVDGHWHQLALGVEQDSTVHTYLDCRWLSTDILRRDSLVIPDDADLIIGYLFSGDLEQLTLLVDPNAASEQCSTNILSSVDTVSDTTHPPDHPTGRKHHRTESKDLWKLQRRNEILQDDEDLVEGSGSETPLSRYEYVWTEWSKCSVSCGLGVQTRKVSCSEAGVWMDLCLEEGQEKTETRPCSAPPCKHEPDSNSNVDDDCHCQNGGTCHPKRQTCHCAPGYQGAHCEIRSCPGPCLHGGICHNSGYCSCPPEYTGDTCQTPVCQPPCMNGGLCVKPGVCSCPSQFNHPRCAALCPGGCEPGGACVSPGVCQCRPGFRGSLCQESLCPTGCFNGGVCVAPNLCNCTAGWSGNDCSKPVCDPPCQRGGSCVDPQQCLCPAGTFGPRCQNYTCSRGCVNGGVCVGPELCECPANASGPSCAQPLCDPPCENGASCAPGNTCLCGPHTSGTRCQTKNCDYRFVQEPYTRGFKKLVKKRVETKCGLGSKPCFRTIAEYQTVYKTFYRTVYKCANGPAR